MRKCPVKSCGCKIADRMFVCNFHWHRLPPDIRRVVSDSYRDYIEEDISHSQLKAVTDQVLADYQGIPVEQVTHENPLVRIGRCRHCSMTLVFPTDSFLAGYEQNENGDTVVIGGRVTAACGKAPIYTRFYAHMCDGLLNVMKGVRCDDGNTGGQSVRPVCGTVCSPGTHAGAG